MSKQLANIDTQAVVGSFTQAELDTLKATIARGTTNEQFALFVQTCVRSGLNPFLNQIYCIVYNGKDGPVMSIQIAVEGIVALAKRHPQYKGFIASEVKENDEFEIDVVSGEPKHRITTMQRGQTVGAYCVAYREGAPNIAVIITRDQVDHLVKGRNGQMWKDYFDDMIVKHAVKRAFKRQFGIEVAEDEYGTAGAEIPAYEPPTRRDITDEVNVTSGQAQESMSQESQQDDEAAKMANLRQQMNAKFKQLGIAGKEAKAAYIAEKGVVKGETPTLQELTKLIKLMDVDIAKRQAQAADDDLLEG
ncbi:RecT family recombinase [Paenibacillus ginsengihumi]|uniref:RecT family recombinase n=1 Tax=Paenibacillus ginsengihumi TaxID=431596 RepID=UPI00036B522F|nr:RecT family recombinase [Paenibacillus ginsengihumi]